MSDDTPAGDYAAFIAGLPRELETDLATSEKASTAFFTARRAGWTTDDLVGDASHALRRGVGVGGVIRRLESLAQTRPVDRPVPGKVIPLRRSWAAVEGEWCPCRGDVPHRVAAAITPDQARERMFLLERCVAEDLDPDVSEQRMRELIATQHAPVSW